MTKIIFKNFVEYWHYARHLSKEQRKSIFNSLTEEQQHVLTNSYTIGKWDDVFVRDEIDEILDELKDKYEYDMLEIKCKVLSGRSVYIPIVFWNEVVDKLGGYNEEHIRFIFGGIEALKCDNNKDVALLVRSN